MDRSEPVFRHHALGDHDRVFEVVAVPRHERDHHVLPQRQLAHVGRCPVRHHVAARDHVAHAHQRTLVDVGVLVGAGVFGQVVDIHPDFARHGFFVADTHHDTAGVHIVHAAAAPCLHRRAGVDRHGALDPGTDQRLLGAQHRYRLALHVGAHQGAVRVIVLQERDQRSRDRYHLRRCHVHVFDVLRLGQHELVVLAGGHDVVGKVTLLVQFGIRLRNGKIALLDRGQIVHLVQRAALGHLAVRRFDEAVFVGAGIQRQGVDQADVRAFRGFDRTHAAVVGRVHVAHLEAGALARQAAGAEGGNPSLVGHFGQRVCLVHELRQLRGAKEFLHRRRDRLGVDQVVRHQVIRFGLAEAFLDRALDAGEADAELVLRQFAHGAHTAVAEVIDVVDLAAPVAQLDQDLHHLDDILVGQDVLAGQFLAPDSAVELHAPDGGQVVTLFIEEQTVEQPFHRIFGRRLAGTHHAVDRDTRRPQVGRFIHAQGLRDIGALIQFVGVQRLDFGDAGLPQGFQQCLGNLVIGIGDNFAAVLVHQVIRQHAPQQKLVFHRQLVDARFLDFTDVAHGDTLVLRHDQLAVLGGDIETRDFPAQTLRHHLELGALLAKMEGVKLEKHRQNLLRRVADRFQQNGDRQFAPAVNTEIHKILGIELEVQPGTAIGDHARGEQQLAGGVCLAAVMLEEHPGRTVQLRHDHTLGAVDHKRTGVGHQRNLAHIDFLLLDLFDLGLGRLLVEDGQTHPRAQRRSVGQAALLAFAHIKRRHAQLVADKIETGKFVVALDRENRIERGLQPVILALFGRRPCLQERAVGFQLGGKQKRHRQCPLAFRKTLTYAFFFSERAAHIISTTVGKPRLRTRALRREPAYRRLYKIHFACESPRCAVLGILMYPCVHSGSCAPCAVRFITQK